ncbi:F-box only protein 43 [Denticeps clupeoides]|uniref:F-box only protein 43 n=1 Tax=Denticeps clupeoides TaxID=299321 RepID=UPI0010A344FB|nr:F-box only protein 43 [Denticeps clupeoides]
MEQRPKCLEGLNRGPCGDLYEVDPLHSSRLKVPESRHEAPAPRGTPKENVTQLNAPWKDRAKGDAAASSRKEVPSRTGWCETPRASKKDAASLRRRLLGSRSATDGKMCPLRIAGVGGATPSGRERTDRLDSRGGSLDLDSPDATFATSTLKGESAALCGRNWRGMFSHVRSSTLEDGHFIVPPSPFQSAASHYLPDADLDESIITGRFEAELPETPQCVKRAPPAQGGLRTPVNLLSALSTPSLTPNSKMDASPSGDSGFGSLGLDKSHDLSVDYDGSFQEFLPPSASKGKATPRPVDGRRRSRLERQRRLSTLREAGSQSEEDARAAPAEPDALLSRDGDELFLDASGSPDLSLTPALKMVYGMCRRGARMLGQQSSLEDLVRGPEPPLAGLIGRKIGAGQLDIVAELKRRNLRHVLSAILKHLSPQDIYNFGQVSEDWDQVVVQDKQASRTRKGHVKNQKLALELDRAAHTADAETRLSLATRPALRSVQAQARTPGATPSGKSTLTPVQRGLLLSSAKREEFLQVAKTLFNDESLKPCPLCQHPARCHPVKKEGVCSRADCAFRFCTTCLCAYHGSKECSRLSARRHNKRDVLPGSAQSKRNVKRL